MKDFILLDEMLDKQKIHLNKAYEEGYKEGYKDGFDKGYGEKQTGHWIDTEFRKEEYVLTGKCSVCGRVRVIGDYCPSCGARMVASKESEVRDEDSN